MVIEVVIFFIWVFIVLLVGVIVVLGRKRRRRLQSTDNVNALSFPQRHWLPLCLAIAVISPLVVSGVKTMTHKKVQEEPVVRTGTDYAAGDSASKDTAYHVATPPQR